jgi:hypothetical protein
MGAEKGLLGDFLGLGPATHHAKGHAIDAVLVDFHHIFKGLRITGPQAGEEGLGLARTLSTHS